MIRFVIISQARSGSTMLGTTIARHPQVLMHGEVFGAGHFPLNFYGIDENLPWPTPIEIYLKKMRDDDPTAFLQNMVFADSARLATGLKFKYEEFSIWPAVKNFIKDQKIPIIYIKRQNLLDRYLSEVEASLTGLFNSTDRTTSGAIGETDIANMLSFASICNAIDLSLRYEQEFVSHFSENPILNLLFEDAIHNSGLVSQKICQFLTIVEMQLAPESSRQPQRRQIEAYFDRNDIRQKLIDSGYQNHIA